jgi:hypothetical protein
MEDVLDLYARPYDPKRPVVCFDEQPRQLIAEVRTPVPMVPGRPQRVDYEYRRAGTANLFLAFEPLAGWRHLEVTVQRTAGDFARQMKALVEVHYPEAEVIAVVLDNLSTHSPAALIGPSGPRRPCASSSAWSSTTRPSTARGSTWPSLSSPFSAGNASTVVCRTVTASRGRLRLGKGGAIASV